MKLRIFSWNINGIRAISKKNVFDWLEEYTPNILALQEIKATEKQIPKLFEYSYNNCIVNSGKLKNQSGVLTYSNIDFDSNSFCENIDDRFEGRIIENNIKDVYILNIYIPNGKASKERLQYKLEFYEKLLYYSSNLIKKGKSVIICGDFNTAHKDIDLKQTKILNRSGFTEKEREYLEKFFERGFIDSYRYICGNKNNSYTWWSYRSKGREKNEGWRIDYILVSNDLKDKIIDAFILNEVFGSDHCPIGIEIKL